MISGFLGSSSTSPPALWIASRSASGESRPTSLSTVLRLRIELVFDEDLGDLDLRGRERVFHRALRGVVARFVEGGVRKLVPHRLAQGGEIGHADRLRELVVERRKDFFRDLRRPDAERAGLP